LKNPNYSFHFIVSKLKIVPNYPFGTVFENIKEIFEKSEEDPV
jgi:hypothetical protein